MTSGKIGFINWDLPSKECEDCRFFEDCGCRVGPDDDDLYIEGDCIYCSLYRKKDIKE